MNDENAEPTFKVETVFNLVENYNRMFVPKKGNSWHPMKVVLKPSVSDNWTFTTLMIFLNELTEFDLIDHSFTVKNKGQYKKACFHFQSVLNLKSFIHATVSNKIKVKVTTDFIKNGWIPEYAIFESDIGLCDKTRKKKVKQVHARFYKVYKMSPTSIAMQEKKTLFLFIKENFSKIFQYFSEHMWLFNCPLNSDTEMLNQYIKLFKEEKKKTIIRQFSDLDKEGMKGILHLKLEPIQVNKRILKLEVNEVEYYIHSGVFIFPKAYDLLHKYKNSIKGFILDTTWKILPLYVTSILAACFANTSVPIGFAFGTGETKKLYKFLIKTIEDKLQFSFKGVILESDQGGS